MIGLTKDEPECPRSVKQTEDRAGNGARTRDINLGKVALYQLSYSRIAIEIFLEPTATIDRQARYLFACRTFQYTKNDLTVQALFSKSEAPQRSVDRRFRLRSIKSEYDTATNEDRLTLKRWTRKSSRLRACCIPLFTMTSNSRKSPRFLTESM